MTALGTAALLRCPFADVVCAVTSALAEQGFGVLTEIDVRATMKVKLGVDVDPYVILGACNPPLAHRALQADPSLGLLLPCNVTVRDTSDGVLIQAVDPRIMVSASASPDLMRVAEEAAAKLEAAIAALGTLEPRGERSSETEDSCSCPPRI